MPGIFFVTNHYLSARLSLQIPSFAGTAVESIVEAQRKGTYLGGWGFRQGNEIVDSPEQTINVRFNHVGISAGLDGFLPVSFISRAGEEKNRRVRSKSRIRRHNSKPSISGKRASVAYKSKRSLCISDKAWAAVPTVSVSIRASPNSVLNITRESSSSSTNSTRGRGCPALLPPDSREGLYE
jgi:hypothetical protein